MLKTLAASGHQGNAIETQLMPSSPGLVNSRMLNSKVLPRFSKENYICGGSLRTLPSMAPSDAQGIIDEMSSSIQAGNSWVQMEVLLHTQMVGTSPDEWHARNVHGLQNHLCSRHVLLPLTDHTTRHRPGGEAPQFAIDRVRIDGRRPRPCIDTRASPACELQGPGRSKSRGHTVHVSPHDQEQQRRAKRQHGGRGSTAWALLQQQASFGDGGACLQRRVCLDRPVVDAASSPLEASR